jgi:Cof subfamily protein (haloacid dehalogenase superfamily)
MDKQYILTDLDGTLLRSESTLSPFSKDTLSAALDAGHVVSYATARSYASSQTKVSAIPWKYPLILYNGALLIDPLTQKTITGSWLSHELTHDLILLGKKYDQTPFLFHLDENEEESVLHEQLRKEGEQGFYNSRPNDRRFHQVPSLQFNHPSQKALIVTYIGTYTELKPFYEDILEKYREHVRIHFSLDTYLKDQYFLEISHPDANKKEAALRWAELVGCDPKQMIVFGDNFNDFGLFEAAGLRLAVSNARPELKQKADKIIESNDQDGVAHYIKQMLT